METERKLDKWMDGWMEKERVGWMDGWRKRQRGREGERDGGRVGIYQQCYSIILCVKSDATIPFFILLQN